MGGYPSLAKLEFAKLEILLTWALELGLWKLDYIFQGIRSVDPTYLRIGYKLTF